MRHFTLVAFATLAVLATSAGQVDAQQPQARQGFWFNAGLGVGSLGCADCSDRVSSLSGNLSIGGTISPRFLLGAGTTGWTKSEDGVTLSAGTLDARVRFYPSVTGGFFLTGGLGIGTVSATVSGAGISDSEIGAGALIGLGYDIRVSRNLSITPYFNGFAVNSSNVDANVSQIGIGITTH